MKLYIALLALASFATSCKKDVEGCTDPTSVNYNPDANINVDCKYKGCTDKDAENYDPKANVEGTCVFARDKFLGDYTGSITCPGALNLLNGTSNFSISEKLGGGKNDINIILLTTAGVTIPATGICEKNNLKIKTELKGVKITILGTEQIVDIKVTGDVVMSDDKKNLTGPVTIEAVTALGPLKDNCTLTGVRK